MNLKCTTLTVDRCTPRDRFARVTQTSFQTSIDKSIDDFFLESSFTPFYSPIGEHLTVLARPRAHSDVSNEADWRTHNNSMAHLVPDHYYDHPDPPRAPTPIDFFHPPTPPIPACTDIFLSMLDELPSPTLTQDTWSPILHDPVPATPVDLYSSHPIWIVDSSLREVDFDVTCLRALDDQLLHSPKDCFLEICWAEAVYDDVEVPMLQPQPRVSQSQTEKKASFQKTRPHPLMMQLDENSSPLASPPSFLALSPQRYAFEESESHMLYQNLDQSFHFSPVPQPRDSHPKPCESQVADEPLDDPCGKTYPKLKLFSDTYDTLTGWRRNTPNV